MIVDHYSGIPILGYLGVVIFFVLSGFLITWLLLNENEKRGTISLSVFYERRLLRIFPAFYVFWGIYVAGRMLAHMALPWAQLLSAFVYIGNYYLAIVNPPTMAMPHTWSLAIEEQFYVLWPLVFLLHRKNLRRLTWMLVAVIAAIWLHRGILYWVNHASKLYILNAFDTRADHLLAGCLLAVLHKQGRLAPLWHAVCSRAWLPLVSVLVLACSMLANRHSADRFLTVNFALDPLIVAVLLTQLIVLSSRRGWSWLNSPVTRYFGRISYPLYLYHGLARDLALRIPHASTFLVWLVGLALSVVVASGSYYIVERPFLMLKGRIRHKRPAVVHAILGA